MTHKWLLFGILIFFLFSCDQAKNKTISTEELAGIATEIPTENIEIKSENDTLTPREISIIGVGDIMLGSNYPSKKLLPHNDTNILSHLSEELQNADLTFGNLEGTIFDHGGIAKNCVNPENCYVFRTPSKYGKYLADAGFDVMSIANNHSGDFGTEGRKKTKENLTSLGIKFAGLLDSDESAIFEKDGVTYGFSAFAPNKGTVDINNLQRARELISELKKKVNIVIVSFHGGAEGDNFQHIPQKNEIYFGENRGNVYEFSHAVIDAGADLVFGHGPHVTRALELYKGKFIAYSLGNFATYGNFSLSGSKGIAPIVKVILNEKGDFVEGSIISTFQKKNSGPKIDPENRALQKVINLTKTDFPQSLLKISADGKITIKE